MVDGRIEADPGAASSGELSPMDESGEDSMLSLGEIYAQLSSELMVHGRSSLHTPSSGALPPRVLALPVSVSAVLPAALPLPPPLTPLPTLAEQHELLTSLEVETRIVSRIRELVTYTGPRGTVCTSAAVITAAWALTSVFGVMSHVQVKSVVAISAAVGYRLWYKTVDAAVLELLGGKNRRTVARHSGVFTKVLDGLCTGYELSGKVVLRRLIEQAAAQT